MTAAAPGAPRRRLIRGETRDAWIFITPALIGFLLFFDTSTPFGQCFTIKEPIIGSCDG